MKQLLKDFVDWLELCHYQGGPCGSPFEQPVPPEPLAWAERALEFALATSRSVTIFTRNIPPQAVVANLIFRRAAVGLEDVYGGELSDDAFQRLTSAVGLLSKTKIELMKGPPIKSDRISERVAESKFMFVC